MKALSTIFIVLCIAVLSCSDADIDIQEVQGTILLGDRGMTNCPWLINIGNTTFFPTYLPPEYQQERLNVLVKVEFLNNLKNCGASTFEELRIEQIQLLD